MTCNPGNFYFITFADESPQIGSGRRIVFVHSIGYKKTRLRSLGGLKPATVSKRFWSGLERSADLVAVPKSIIKRAFHDKRMAGHTITKSMKELLQ